MSESQFGIRITTTAEGTGAQTTAKDLQHVAEKAEHAGNHSRALTRALRELNPALGELGETLHLAEYGPAIAGVRRADCRDKRRVGKSAQIGRLARNAAKGMMTASPHKPKRRAAAPGWLMSGEQRALFWRLWSAACEAQGWDHLPSAARDAKRLEVLSGLGFDSAKDIDSTRGFDAVKETLERLADIVSKDGPDAGRRRRLLWRANEALRKLRAAGYAEHSIETILADRFKVIAGVNTIDGLPTQELLNLIVTLAARLASWNRPNADNVPQPF